MIAKFTFNYNGGFEKKENAVFQQGSIGVDSYQVFAPFLTTTQVYIKTKRNGDLEFSLWKQLDYNSTIGGWLKTATQDELLVDGEMKVVFKFNNLVSQETSLWVRKGTLIVPEMTTYEALRDYVESVDGRIDQLLAGETSFHHVQFDNTLVDGDVTDKPSIMYDSYEKMFRAINDDDTDIVIGGELQKLVRNENSGDLAEGTIVSISGAVGQRVTIDKFDITSESEHARIPAVITKSGVIALHGLGKVSFFGEIKGLPIANFEVTGTAYAEGQPLYCSINSKITNVAPAKPNLHVHIGTLERIVGTTANVFIHTLVIPHFSHLSDVEITTPQEGDIYVKTGSKVMNSQRLVIAESEITKIKDGTTIVKKAEQDKNGNDIVATYETKSDATSKKLELDGEILALDGRVEDLETANMIKSYTYNPSTHVLTFTYFDNTTTSFDLPLESAIVDASYDNVTKDITFTLQSGATLVVPLDDLISGLASETWVTTNFIPKTALKTSFSATTLDTNVISEKLAKDTFDTKEAIANKATDFSVVNDTKYPTTKAVAEIGLDTPIVKLGNQTLRKTFGTDQLLVNGSFDNSNTWTLTNITISDGKLNYNTTSSGYVNKSGGNQFTFISGKKYYIVFDVNVIARTTGSYGIRVNSTTPYYGLATSILGEQRLSGLYEPASNINYFIFGVFDNGNGQATFDNLRFYDTQNYNNLTIDEINYYYNLYVELQTKSTNQYLMEKVETIEELELKYINLLGKKLYSFGDSILDGVPAFGNVTFASLIANKYEMNYTKYAYGGATFIVQSGITNNILKQVNNASATIPDYILFNGYTNDCNVTNITTTLLGSITSDFTDTFDTSTFCGAMEKTIYTLITKYRGAKIVFVTTHINSARDYTVQKTLYTKAMEICAKWGIAVADVFTESNLNTFISAYSTNYTDGGSHPNEEGYKLFYLPVIENKIKY